jgi:hypothetical protein
MSMKLFHRTARRVGTILAASLAGGLIVPAIAAPAGAAVPAAPAPGHLFSILQDASALELTLDPNQDFTAELIRNGVTIGTTSGTTDPAGDSTVNGGGPCWVGSTPEILPGDIVRTTTAAGVEEMIVQGLSVTQPATDAGGGTVTVKGRAVDGATGTPLADPAPIAEVRVIGGPFTASINSNRLLADNSGGADGLIANDPSTPGGFIATFSGLSAQDVASAVAADSEARFRTGVNLNEVTIVTFGTVAAPFAGCPAVARNAVTGSTPTIINVASLGDVVLAGASQDATSVTARLSDGVRTVTSNATLSAPAGGQTWTAAIPANQVGSLADGTLTADASYVTPAGTITGATLSIVKDTAAPAAPTASPLPGTYAAAQAVTLSAEPGAAIHATFDGSTATAGSPVVAGQLQITSSQTISALAVDSAGNPSPVATFGYTITPPAPPAPPVTTAPPVVTAPAPAAPVVTAPAPVVAPVTVRSAPARRITCSTRRVRGRLVRTCRRVVVRRPVRRTVRRASVHRHPVRRIVRP